jgi:RNA polymerase sigma-70 factor (ECF subfamily)
MKEDRVSDLSLVRQFKKGSTAAFEEIVSRYESRAFNLALKFTRNREDAEEVLNDVFTTLFKKIASFQGKSAFSSWLYRIVVNAAFMKLRKRKQQHTIAIEDLAPSIRQQYLDWPDQLLESRSDNVSINNQLKVILEGAVRRLPEQYRSVFVLRDVDGLSNQEVSEILSISIPAVKSRLHRSRLMLRKRLLRHFREFVGREPEPMDEDLDGMLAAAV